MKNIFPFVIFVIVALLSSCTSEDIPIIPTPPVVPAADRNLSFHCSIHNLNYRFAQYTDDTYKGLKMPCPICKFDSANAFMAKNGFMTIQLLCPIDSTWTNFNLNTTDKNFLLRDKKPFYPIIPTPDSFKGFTIDALNTIILSNVNKDLIHFPDCWCEAYSKKAHFAAIKFKQDSIVAFKNSINGIIGMTFTSYPVNTGVPPDRRIRAMAILDSIERILPNIERFYNRNYSTINGFVGVFSGNRQRYIYSQKTGTAIDSYVSEDIAFKKISADEFISDTVVINIGGGPDYLYDGTGTLIPLYKEKSSNTIQSVKALKKVGYKNLSNGPKKIKSRRSKTDSQYQLSTDFTPGSIDFLPSQYLSRKYNTYTTSVFNIFHPQKGNQLYPNGTMYTWNFIDMAKSVGGWNQQYPNNIVGAYTAEVANDIGTMEIRKVVEWCKARGKHIVLMGSSWGGAMIFNYLLYYTSADFDQIIIADQNPNMPASLLEAYMNDYIYGGTALQYGTDPTYKQINLNMCLITSDTYRRLDWLKNQNLRNTTFYYSTTDSQVLVQFLQMIYLL